MFNFYFPITMKHALIVLIIKSDHSNPNGSYKTEHMAPEIKLTDDIS